MYGYNHYLSGANDWAVFLAPLAPPGRSGEAFVEPPMRNSSLFAAIAAIGAALAAAALPPAAGPANLVVNGDLSACNTSSR